MFVKEQLDKEMLEKLAKKPLAEQEAFEAKRGSGQVDCEKDSAARQLALIFLEQIRHQEVRPMDGEPPSLSALDRFPINKK